jgi:hypothetical protein
MASATTVLVFLVSTAYCNEKKASATAGPKESTELRRATEELDVLQKDAERVATGLFRHYGLERISSFTPRNQGTFARLVKEGVFSTNDAASIAKHHFERFYFRKNAGYSRRYELTINSDRGWAATVQLNHLGEVIRIAGEADISSDLPADVKLMWSVDNAGRSPEEAIEAASRVFNTVKLVGMDRDEVFKQIGNHSHRPKGIYNFPFLPRDRDEIVYRFDNGRYGWQFNVKFDEKRTCTGVTRLWIH